jgi:hypothetical protein
LSVLPASFISDSTNFTASGKCSFPVASKLVDEVFICEVSRDKQQQPRVVASNIASLSHYADSVCYGLKSSSNLSISPPQTSSYSVRAEDFWSSTWTLFVIPSYPKKPTTTQFEQLVFKLPAEAKSKIILPEDNSIMSLDPVEYYRVHITSTELLGLNRLLEKYVAECHLYPAVIVAYRDSVSSLDALLTNVEGAALLPTFWHHRAIYVDKQSQPPPEEKRSNTFVPAVQHHQKPSQPRRNGTGGGAYRPKQQLQKQAAQ